jgi:single-strand DNA-binding protein
MYVEGRLRTRKWQNKEGVDQFTTEVVADQMQMLGGRDGAAGDSGEPPSNYEGSSGGGSGGSSGGRSSAPASRPNQASRPAAPAAGGANLGDLDDDIPF